MVITRFRVKTQFKLDLTATGTELSLAKIVFGLLTYKTNTKGQCMNRIGIKSKGGILDALDISTMFISPAKLQSSLLRANFQLRGGGTVLLPNSAPSWIFSWTENLSSSNLQDGASEKLDYVENPTHPPPPNFCTLL